mmetsp:Transcript_18501/g.55004  ORF Transcript_18501/g.55004 Transcript_18501/m.55004 type:complete len:205 (-) Transcript_18501:298-912(-)
MTCGATPVTMARGFSDEATGLPASLSIRRPALKPSSRTPSAALMRFPERSNRSKAPRLSRPSTAEMRLWARLKCSRPRHSAKASPTLESVLRDASTRMRVAGSTGRAPSRRFLEQSRTCSCGSAAMTAVGRRRRRLRETSRVWRRGYMPRRPRGSRSSVRPRRDRSNASPASSRTSLKNSHRQGSSSGDSGGDASGAAARAPPA